MHESDKSWMLGPGVLGEEAYKRQTQREAGMTLGPGVTGVPAVEEKKANVRREVAEAVDALNDVLTTLEPEIEESAVVTPLKSYKKGK